MAKKTASEPKAAPETQQASTPPPPHVPSGSAGATVGLPRFDFNRQPVAPEASSEASLASQAIRPSYEQIRDSVPHDFVRQRWSDADTWVRQQRELVEKVADDESLSDEGKREKVARTIEAYAPKATQAYQEARAKAKTASENFWMSSVPMPNARTLANTGVGDSTEMIAVQNEANALAQRIEGKSLQQLTQEVSKNPRDRGIQQAAGHTLSTLRAEFDTAMHTGGVEGKVKALAIKRYADAAGLSLDDITDHHRGDSHRKAYQDHVALDQASASIPSGRGLEQNPYDDNRRRGGKGVGTYRSQNVMSSGRPRLFENKRRKPLWK